MVNSQLQQLTTENQQITTFHRLVSGRDVKKLSPKEKLSSPRMRGSRFLFWMTIFFVGMTSWAFSSEVPLSREPPSFPGEYVIITGAPSLIEWEKFKEQPHDKYWGNFVRASRVRIAELRKAYGTSFPITWLVYRKGYERRQQRQDKTDLISHIQSVRDKYAVKLVWFSTGQELIHYLNGGKIAPAQPRNSAKLLGLEYFGHSNRACFMFDYSNEIDSASKAYLHENDLKQIQKNIFVPRPVIKSWGCYTAQSMSRKWRAATGRKMLGATGKTDYSNGYMNGGSLPLVQGRWGG